jgi:hypothetical protein
VVNQIERLKLDDGTQQFTGRRLFEESRRWVRWPYQWMVVHDFLKRVCGAAVVDSILKNESAPTGPTVELQFYQPREQPFMPIEFSAASVGSPRPGPSSGASSSPSAAPPPSSAASSTPG